MGDLTDIWNDSTDIIFNDNLVDIDAVSVIYKKLKEEERLQRKFQPWLKPYVLLIGGLLLLACSNGASLNLDFGKALGVLIITIGGIVYMMLVSKVKWFKENYNYNLPSIEFLKTLVSSLNLKRKNHKRAIFTLIICLTIGLQLMIFGNSLVPHNLLLLIIYYFFMILFGIVAILKTMKDFDSYYQFISSKYEDWTKENNAEQSNLF